MACLSMGAGGVATPSTPQPVRPTPPASIEQRLKELTPAYPAPQVGRLGAQEERGPALRLLGVDLLQKEMPVVQGRVDSSQPLTVVCYWMPENRLKASLPMELRFSSDGERVTSPHEFTVDTAGGRWQPGCVYKQAYSVDMVEVAHNLSGKTSLVISLLSKVRTSFQPVPLQRLDVRISPHTGSGRLSARSIEAAFGAGARALSVSFRLGSEAEQTITIAPEMQEGWRRIGLASAFSYGSVLQGNPVCEVEAIGRGGQRHVWTLLSGKETARADYDLNPTSMNHEKVRIVESWDADYLDVDDKPFRKHAYGCVLELPEGFGPLVSLRFCSRCSIIFEVYDVTLLPPT